MNSENYNPNPWQPEPGPESGPETQVEKSSEGSAHPFGSELPSALAASERHTDVQANGVVKPPVAEDLRVPWGWWDLALFAVIAAIGFLTFAFLIIAVFQTAGISRVQFQNSIKYQ